MMNRKFVLGMLIGGFKAGMARASRLCLPRKTRAGRPCYGVWGPLLIAALALVVVGIVAPTGARADQAADAAARQRARDRWENVVIWFGDEETGEWSLRIRDQDVHDRGWFEFLELWQFDLKEKRWVQLKSEKIAKAIVMPKDKTSDQPEKEQTLYELKEIEPKTAGLWYAKWRIDDVDCTTGPMRVGTGRHSNQLQGDPPQGMIKFVVPIDLNKSEVMFIPDPRIYCIAGSPGKPDGKTAPKPTAKQRGPGV